ncbi:hypothetical protein AGDE_07389 [Angomonas deanei]|uniref:Leucine Rich repeat n=1 Tax=Angomonas deanei TaxID=59799 RepID=A0A7G2C477_9TRYP|nr:hypothetical protein AGDE_07389 [Angomonas deanei]CAD2212712.1 hypothetical protein, conserved [Angomonas deanei]|eukprot:EPY35395.1 hypothetical protein AGDE_07389 [Angomonas deanei]
MESSLASAFLSLYNHHSQEELTPVKRNVVRRVCGAMPSSGTPDGGLCVVLDNIVLDEVEMAAFAPSLASLPLLSLSLKESYIGDSGLRLLLEHLENGKPITDLSMKTPRGEVFISAALPIQELILSHNSLSIVAPLVHYVHRASFLSVLDLSGNRIGLDESSVSSLLSSLSSHTALRELNLSSNYLQGSVVVSALSELIVQSGSRHSALRRIIARDNYLSKIDYRTEGSGMPFPIHSLPHFT